MKHILNMYDVHEKSVKQTTNMCGSIIASAQAQRLWEICWESADAVVGKSFIQTPAIPYPKVNPL